MRCTKCQHVWVFKPSDAVGDGTDPYARFGQALGELRRKHSAESLTEADKEQAGNFIDSIPEALKPGGAPLKTEKAKKEKKSSKIAAWIKGAVLWWHGSSDTVKASAGAGFVMGLAFIYTVAILSATKIVSVRSAFSPVFDAMGVVHSIPGDGLNFENVRLRPMQMADGSQRLQVFGTIQNDSDLPRPVPSVEAYIETPNGHGDTMQGDAANKILPPGKATEFLLSFNGWPPYGSQVNIRFHMP